MWVKNILNIWMENTTTIKCVACCKDSKRCELPVKWCTEHIKDYSGVGWGGGLYHIKEKNHLKEDNKNIISLFELRKS